MTDLPEQYQVFEILIEWAEILQRKFPLMTLAQDIADARTALDTLRKPTQPVDEEALGELAVDLIDAVIVHIHNGSAPLRSVVCRILRPHFKAGRQPQSMPDNNTPSSASEVSSADNNGMPEPVLSSIIGGLELLHLAVCYGDPHAELRSRTKELLLEAKTAIATMSKQQTGDEKWGYRIERTGMTPGPLGSTRYDVKLTPERLPPESRDYFTGDGRRVVETPLTVTGGGASEIPVPSPSKEEYKPELGGGNTLAETPSREYAVALDPEVARQATTPYPSSLDLTTPSGQPDELPPDLHEEIERLRGLNEHRTPQQGHSWVHSFFRRGKQYGSSVCWGERGARIFRIDESDNPNAEADYQFYVNAPQMMEAIEQLVALRLPERESNHQAEKYRAIAHFLYNVLDDIDTADDVAKADGALYRALVRKAHAQRHIVADCDGFTVTFKDDLPIPTAPDNRRKSSDV